MNKMSYYQKQRIKNIFRIALKFDYSEVECFKKHTLEFLYLKSLITTLNSNKWHKMKWKQEKKILICSKTILQRGEVIMLRK